MRTKLTIRKEVNKTWYKCKERISEELEWEDENNANEYKMNEKQ